MAAGAVDAAAGAVAAGVEAVVVGDSLTLQWHVTEKCNLNCRHCYQSSEITSDPDMRDLMTVLDQFLHLLEQVSRSRGRPIPAHINVTGGEPFIRGDFPDFLAILALHRKDFSFGVLTNGVLIDRAAARMLAERCPAYVQVSLDGGRETHDRIRGKGGFDAVRRAIGHLRKAGVRVQVAFTAHSGNFEEFGAVAAAARGLGADRVWADRMVPLGRGGVMERAPLSPAESRRFIKSMAAARDAASRAWFNRTRVAMHRALQFAAGGPAFRCRAGGGLIAVMTNGDLVPCRRMPIYVGNLFQESLARLYVSAPLFRQLRNPERIPEACHPCVHVDVCRGGARCLACAISGDPFGKDPGCWMAI